jgi:2-oxoisovalerate dehydrogenase E1 component
VKEEKINSLNKMPSETPLCYSLFPKDAALLSRLFESMLLLRRFEELIRSNLEPVKKIGTPCHLYIGQEAVAVGVCAALEKADMIFGNHRSHGHYLAKGGDLDAAMAEIYCRQTGCSHGRGGSMHLIDLEHGVMGTSSIVAGSVPLAVGSGLSSAMQENGKVSVVFHGDGVPEEGVWNESANLAALNRLPVLFACENNLYCTHLPLDERRVRNNLSELAAAHGLRVYKADGNNVEEVYRRATEAVNSIRNGEGPAFLECTTYRWLGHVGPKDDLHVGLRDEKEVAAWKERCPIANLERHLLKAGMMTEAAVQEVHARVEKRLAAALEKAEKAPSPVAASLTAHVYAESAPSAYPAVAACPGDETRVLTYVEAIHDGHQTALATVPEVYVMGQGVDNPWCVGTSTKGLLDRFGPARVRDVPISENAMTGAAIGSAMAGLRPIVFHPRMDFMYLAMDQIINHCALWHYMFDGQVKIPITIRGIINRRGEQGAQHSQSPYSMFAHVPGLKIVMPASPFDAKGLLLAAVADDGPVLFIDDRALYELSGPVPEAGYAVPIGKAAVLREGTDITIVAISAMVPEALQAAMTFAESGVEAEVIDLRTVKPMDTEAVLKSVRKTGRLCIADPAWPYCGIAAHLSAIVAEALHGALKAPVQRVTFPDVPMPAARTLEEAYYPGSADILKACRSILSSRG